MLQFCAIGLLASTFSGIRLGSRSLAACYIPITLHTYSLYLHGLAHALHSRILFILYRI